MLRGLRGVGSRVVCVPHIMECVPHIKGCVPHIMGCVPHISVGSIEVLTGLYVQGLKVILTR